MVFPPSPCWLYSLCLSAFAEGEFKKTNSPQFPLLLNSPFFTWIVNLGWLRIVYSMMRFCYLYVICDTFFYV